MDGRVKTRASGSIPQTLGQQVGLMPLGPPPRRRLLSTDEKSRTGPPISSVVLGRSRGPRTGSGSRSKQNLHVNESATRDVGTKMTVRKLEDSHTESILTKHRIKPSVSDHLVSGATTKKDQGQIPNNVGNSRRVRSRPGSGRNQEKHSARDESDIKFIDVPNSSRSDTCENDGRDSRQIKSISPEDILLQCQETDFGHVYDICLHAANIGVIEHMEKFKKLRVLDLSCNFIEKIERLELNQDLRDLKLYDNRITILVKLDNLKELCSLQLQHNRIRKIGRGFLNLKKLRCLRLDSNKILAIEPREVSCCMHLTTLDVSYNLLDNLTAFNYLPNLEELKAVGNRLRRVSDLSQCKRLQEIDLSRNKITDLSGLRKLPSLQVLNICSNELKSLKSIGKSMSLSEILASDNKLSELSTLSSQFPHLEILNIVDNVVSEWEEICSMENMSELVELYLAGNPFKFDGQDRIPYHSEIQHVLPNLEILDGAHVKRHINRTVPLMRPMSASSVVSVRQMEVQINSVKEDLAEFERSFLAKFDALKTSCQELPAEAPMSARKPKLTDDLSIIKKEDGNSSRCSRRARIQDAQAYAAMNS